MPQLQAITKLTILFATILFSCVTRAATPLDGLYGSLFGGYAYLPSNINQTSQFIKRNDAIYQSGYDAGGNFGFKSNTMRYEGEITYLDANIQHFKANNITQKHASGYNNAIFAMANVYYDFPECIRTIQPFLGLGIGYGWVHVVLHNSIPPAPLPNFSNANSVFGYQGTAGLSYNFAEKWSLTLAYRYLGTQHVDGLGSIFQAHLANVGATYRFNEID